MYCGGGTEESICSPLSQMLVVKHADIKIGIAEKPSNQIYICVFYHRV